MSEGQNPDTSGKKTKSSQKEKKLVFSCRSCGTQREAGKRCPACDAKAVPEHQLEAMLRKGKNGWQIVVQTYKNGIQEPLPFVFDMSGEDCRVIDFNTSWKDSDLQFPGLVICIINIPFKNKARTAKFSIVGSKGTAQDLDIPAEYPRPRFISDLGFVNFPVLGQFPIVPFVPVVICLRPKSVALVRRKAVLLLAV